MDTDIELSLVSLVDSQYRERLRTLLKSERGRKKFIDTLYHHPRFDERFVSEVRMSESSTFYCDAVHADLVGRGAPDHCYVIRGAYRGGGDGSVMPLRAAIDDFCDQGEALVLVCIPGRLAYWEGESGPGVIIQRP